MTAAQYIEITATWITESGDEITITDTAHVEAFGKNDPADWAGDCMDRPQGATELATVSTRNI